MFITILTAGFYFAADYFRNVTFVCLAVLFCSALISNLQIFLQYDEQSINRFHPQFQLCQNTVFKLSNYLTLFAIPFYTNYITEETHTRTSILNLKGALLVIVILMKLYFITKIEKREKREEEKNDIAIDMYKSQVMDKIALNPCASPKKVKVKTIEFSLKPPEDNHMLTFGL